MINNHIVSDELKTKNKQKHGGCILYLYYFVPCFTQNKT